MEEGRKPIGRPAGFAFIAALVLAGGSAIAAPGSKVIGGVAAAGSAAPKCVTTVDRNNPDGTLALSRGRDAQGNCICIVRTGSAETQAPALEKLVATEQQRTDCVEPTGLAPSAETSFDQTYGGGGGISGEDVGRGAILGLFGLGSQAGSFIGKKKRDDSPGG
jgi:hypothetical protein